MDPAHCRDQLGKLMSEETRALNELSVLLDREHGYLEINDVAALEGATRDRQRCVARIIRIEEDRRAMCRELGYSDDLKGLGELLRWCDPRGTLASGWAQCTAAASNCRTLNDRNGALVGARLKHVQARLGVLIEGRREATTYGPRGAFGSGGSGRVLATEA
jgi:flagellar biosynthesis/type III secretory pathway chaperone